MIDFEPNTNCTVQVTKPQHFDACGSCCFCNTALEKAYMATFKELEDISRFFKLINVHRVIVATCKLVAGSGGKRIIWSRAKISGNATYRDGGVETRIDRIVVHKHNKELVNCPGYRDLL